MDAIACVYWYVGLVLWLPYIQWYRWDWRLFLPCYPIGIQSSRRLVYCWQYLGMDCCDAYCLLSVSAVPQKAGQYRDDQERTLWQYSLAWQASSILLCNNCNIILLAMCRIAWISVSVSPCASLHRLWYIGWYAVISTLKPKRCGYCCLVLWYSGMRKALAVYSELLHLLQVLWWLLITVPICTNPSSRIR